MSLNDCMLLETQASATTHSGRVHGIVLAGSHAWDSRSLEALMPRCLLPVALSPLASYALRWLRSGGVEGATLCGNGDSSCIRRALGDGAPLDLDLDYYEDRLPRGPAGCIYDVADAHDADLFIVAEGAVIPTINLGDLLNAHHAAKASVTVALARSDRMRAAEGALRPAGIYILDRRALGYMSQVSYQDIKEGLLPKLAAAGETVAPYVTPKSTLRVRDAHSYLGVNEHVVGSLCRRAEPLPGYRRQEMSLIHVSARVHASARLIGPILIGPDVSVAADATLIGPAVIGFGGRIGRGALLSRAVLWDAVEVAARSIVDRAVLPCRSDVRAGARLNDTLPHAGCRPGECRSAAAQHHAGLRVPADYFVGGVTDSEYADTRNGAEEFAGVPGDKWESAHAE